MNLGLRLRKASTTRLSARLRHIEAVARAQLLSRLQARVAAALRSDAPTPPPERPIVTDQNR